MSFLKPIVIVTFILVNFKAFAGGGEIADFLPGDLSKTIVRTYLQGERISKISLDGRQIEFSIVEGEIHFVFNGITYSLKLTQRNQGILISRVENLVPVAAMGAVDGFSGAPAALVPTLHLQAPGLLSRLMMASVYFGHSLGVVSSALQLRSFIDYLLRRGGPGWGMVTEELASENFRREYRNYFGREAPDREVDEFLNRLRNH